MMYHVATQMWQDLEATGINPAPYFADLLFGFTYGAHRYPKELILKRLVECSYIKELMIALSFWADKQNGYVSSATPGDILMGEIGKRAFFHGIFEDTYIEGLFSERNADDFIWRLEL